ncbi:uncharacterized protein METZ01_LOCUS244281, partial [marine metagenome]
SGPITGRSSTAFRWVSRMCHAPAPATCGDSTSSASSGAPSTVSGCVPMSTAGTAPTISAFCAST